MDLGMISLPTNFIEIRFTPFHNQGAGKLNDVEVVDVAVARRYRITPANIANIAKKKLRNW
jgi:hypothetical protein